MKSRVLLATALLFASAFLFPFVTPQVARAANITTSCKWPFPWPRTVNYYIETGSDLSYQFSPGGANIVEYGGGTWNSANSNLILQRAYSLGAATNSSRIYKVTDYNDDALARTGTYPTTGCNIDQGNPIYNAYTFWNNRYSFYSDCLAVGQLCQQNGYYDIHNLAAHEFTHWYVLTDTYDGADSGDTAYGLISPGETNKRDLSGHDVSSAQIMYGSR